MAFVGPTDAQITPQRCQTSPQGTPETHNNPSNLPNNRSKVSKHASVRAICLEPLPIYRITLPIKRINPSNLSKHASVRATCSKTFPIYRIHLPIYRKPFQVIEACFRARDLLESPSKTLSKLRGTPHVKRMAPRPLQHHGAVSNTQAAS